MERHDPLSNRRIGLWLHILAECVYLLIVSIFNTKILQGNVATRFTWVDITLWASPYCKFTAESAGERIVKIDHQLSKLYARLQCLVFGLFFGVWVNWTFNGCIFHCLLCDCLGPMQDATGLSLVIVDKTSMLRIMLLLLFAHIFCFIFPLCLCTEEYWVQLLITLKIKKQTVVQFAKEQIDHMDYYERCAHCLSTKEEISEIIILLANE